VKTRAPGAFAVLRSKPYRTLWVGGIFVFLAIMGQNIARGWLARKLTGSNAGIGGVLMVWGVAALVLAPVGGVVADRFQKRTVVMVGQLVLLVASVGIGVALMFDALEYWMLLGASALQASGFSLYGPSRVAFTSELVEAREVPRAIALNFMTMEATRVFGPAVAGALLATGAFGEQMIFVGGSVLIAVAMVTSRGLPRNKPRTREVRSPLHDLRAGLAYVRSQRQLKLLVCVSLGVVVTVFPYLAFLPTKADELGVGAGGYGMMQAVAALGAVLAGTLAVRHSSPDLFLRMVIWGVVFGAGVIALGVAPVFVVALVVMPFIGAGGILFQTSNQSLVLILSDLDYHGRMVGLLQIGFSAFGIAALPLGMLADEIGLRPTLVGMGVATALIVVTAAVLGAKDRGMLSGRDIG
jgi:MFS family permease